MSNRRVVTGTVMSQFGPPTKTEYSPFAPLPPELSRLVDQLARLEYPITSKRDLLEKLGGATAPVFVGSNVVEALAALMFIPASLFPAATPANLAEKLSDHYASRGSARQQRDLDAREVQDLARRFIAENPELIVAIAKAVQHLSEVRYWEGDRDEDAVATQFLRDNQRLVDAVAATFRGVSRLRAKSREDLERQGESGG